MYNNSLMNEKLFGDPNDQAYFIYRHAQEFNFKF